MARRAGRVADPPAHWQEMLAGESGTALQDDPESMVLRSRLRPGLVDRNQSPDRRAFASFASVVRPLYPRGRNPSVAYRTRRCHPRYGGRFLGPVRFHSKPRQRFGAVTCDTRKERNAPCPHRASIADPTPRVRNPDGLRRSDRRSRTRVPSGLRRSPRPTRAAPSPIPAGRRRSRTSPSPPRARSRTPPVRSGRWRGEGEARNATRLCRDRSGVRDCRV